MHWARLGLIGIVGLAACKKDREIPYDDDKPFVLTIDGARHTLAHARGVIRDDILELTLSEQPSSCGKPGEPVAVETSGGARVIARIPRGTGDFFSSNLYPVPTIVSACRGTRCTDLLVDLDPAIQAQDPRAPSSVTFVRRPGADELEGSLTFEWCPADRSSRSLPAPDDSRSIESALIDGADVPIAKAITWRTPGLEGVDRLAFYRDEPGDCASAAKAIPLVELRWVGAPLGQGTVPATVSIVRDGAPVAIAESNAATVAPIVTGAHYTGVAVVATRRPSIALDGKFETDVCLTSPGEPAGQWNLVDSGRTLPLTYALAVVRHGKLQLAFADRPLLCEEVEPVASTDDAHRVEMDLRRGLGDFYRGTPVTIRMEINAEPDDDSSSRSLFGALTVEDLTPTTVRVSIALDATENDRRTQFSAHASVPLCPVGSDQRENDTPLAPPTNAPLSAVAFIDADGAVEMSIGPNITCATRRDRKHELETDVRLVLGPQPANFNEDPTVRGATENAYLRIDAIDRVANKLRGALSAQADSWERTPISGRFDAPICTDP